MKNDHLITRHVLKTVSYRAVATLVTVGTAYFVGISLTSSALLGIGELVVKPVIYFVHERFWYKHIKIGIK